VAWQLLVRHAHRHKVLDNDDDPLSEKGRRQAKDLVRFLKAQGLKPERIVSSPKQRCFETAEFLAEWAKVEIEVDKLLLEQQSFEDSQDFRARVSQMAKSLRSSVPTAWVGHGDFMPLVLEELGHPAHELKKGDLFWLEKGTLIGINPVHASSG